MNVSQPHHSVWVEGDVMVPMRDGVRLATDIYHPAQDGKPLEEPLPAILMRTPYSKQEPDRVESYGRWFARRGYVVILQDCRGCYRSEGELSFLTQEPWDGYDTLEWTAQQPWSNGRVGTLGTSYSAWVQSALATQSPPQLTCMFANMGGFNAHTSSVRQGGTMELRFMAWAFWHAALNTNGDLKRHLWVDQALNHLDFRDWLTRLPLRRGLSPLALVPPYERWLFDILTHGDYDDFWRQPGFNIEEHLEGHADVPVLISGGWYDSYTRSSCDYFAALQASKQGPFRLLMGPWTHGSFTCELTYAGDADLGPEAALPSFNELHLRWFDRWLKGMENGVDREPPVHIFVMGGGTGHRNREGRLDHGGRWREEQEWPLARTHLTPLYLHAGGALRAEPPQEAQAHTSYPFDPREPVPTIGGNFSSLHYLTPPPSEGDYHLIPRALRCQPVTPAGGYDQQEGPQFFGCRAPHLPLASRPDVLVFQTPPLETDTEVTGPIEVRLWVSSSAPDTDFTAKLIDVYPPNEDYPEGYALNLSDSIIRARYRHARERPEPLHPGQVSQVTITLYPTSNLFKAGHRIRLDLSSSNFPRFDVNPNTGEPLGQHRRWAVAENTIYHDRDHPSHIVLPVIPPEA
ncbi:MAG: CocE/NonD family hydrolase [Dehalococcoidia bacterium]